MFFVAIRDSKGRDVIVFAPNVGILVRDAAFDLHPSGLFNLLLRAHEHNQDQELLEEVHGNGHPMFATWPGDGRCGMYIGLDDYIRLRDGWREQDAIDRRDRDERQDRLVRRRRGFSAKRDRLVVQMIEAGTPYVCAHPECDAALSLQVDHKHPLAAGGTDEITNLQFMCGPHNASKGARV